VDSGGKQKLVAGTAGPSQSQPAQPQDAFEISEQHLDFLPLVTGDDTRCRKLDPVQDTSGLGRFSKLAFESLENTKLL
jgi:hypothetical protein